MMSKLSLRGKVASNKLDRWVEPSFGEHLGNANLSLSSGIGGVALSGGTWVGKARPSSTDLNSSKRLRKRRADPNVSKLQTSTSTEPAQGDQDEPWVDTHKPHSQAELAVHKKKIEEVEDWMRVHVDPKTAKGGAVLLLTGPSGCGKSATVQVLAQELGYRVQEWSNPSSLSEYRPSADRADPDTYRQTFDPDSRFNCFYGSSQTGLFQEFLLRANKYNRLQMSGEGGASDSDRKLILVEDFPNQFYRQPGSLHDVLRRFVKTCRRPLLFIVSDSLSGDSSSRLLFPKHIQEELGVCNISFNPVAPTSMMKVLSRIVSVQAVKSGGKMCVPDKAALELLCSGSSGDIRSAINSLQFSCLTDQSMKKGFSAVERGKATATSSGRAVVKAMRGKRKAKDSEGQDKELAIGGKDSSLFLFRALGKILYCKRESPEGSEGSQGPSLPAHLSEHHRDRLLVDPEAVVERSHMSGEFFSLYLQQNYLEFFSDVEDVARASEYLSDADFLTAEWSSRSTMGEYGSSVATRGLLHSNSGHVAGGFRPLHKPNWLLVNKKYRENCQAAQSLFISFCLTPVSLQTELLPYLAQLSNPLRNPAQIAFIQDVGCLSRRKLPGRLKLEALTDKDPGLLELDSEEEEEGGLVSSSVDQTSGTLSGETGDQGDPSLEPLLPGSQGPGAGGPGGDLPASQPQPTTTSALLEEEDVVIEEYDSDF
ncbi:cell cycle checkpoint protein RAD17 isoform X1 [Oncorhynchus kisutch]|uniref:RAD17 checkpoint clamp loader component n=1 Tax=Oncorhynchus kisutch TaxID=8019 RepID=A0A8C7JQP9_ONCKI|nr:cell cycle checkpoint protein RAD17 isoform X1 [Oncorhynchus kisutch]